MFIAATFFIVYLFPKGGKFKYEFQKGKPWHYDTLYAPFDFAIKKSSDVVLKEKEEIEKKNQLYYVYDFNTVYNVKKTLKYKFEAAFKNSNDKERLILKANRIKFIFLDFV